MASEAIKAASFANIGGRSSFAYHIRYWIVPSLQEAVRHQFGMSSRHFRYSQLAAAPSTSVPMRSELSATPVCDKQPDVPGAWWAKLQLRSRPHCASSRTRALEGVGPCQLPRPPLRVTRSARLGMLVEPWVTSVAGLSILEPGHQLKPSILK